MIPHRQNAPRQAAGVRIGGMIPAMGFINYEYLRPINEPVWFAALHMRNALRRRAAQSNNATLIINVSLIGEFAASLPAMHALMEQCPGPVDLLVSPPLRSLAERVRGVRKVYTASSSFKRAGERGSEMLPSAQYDTIVAFRMSAGAYHALSRVQAEHVRSGLTHVVSYGFHIGWSMARGKTPMSLREHSFKIAHLSDRKPTLKELFNFTDEEYALGKARVGSGPVVAIHTGASWVRNSWPLENWAALLVLLHTHGYITALVGTQKEQADFDALQTMLPFPIRSLVGLPLPELLPTLVACKAFIGVDSGPRNLAHLCDLRSVTLLGPAPHLFTPHDKRDRVLDKSGGRRVLERYIKTKGKSLMEQHTPQEVFEQFMQLPQ